MNACICCCSITRPSPLNHDPNYPWSLPPPPPSSNSNPYRPNFPLTLKNDSNYHHHHHNLNISSSSARLIARSLQQPGLGVGVVSTDSSSALNSPVIDEEVQVEVEVEVEEVQGPGINGVADTKSQTPSATKTKKKKEEDDDDSFENRFKLRNGREVFEEKAYIVGVERKGDIEDSFGVEESLKELAQLADTAGVLVVGSTHQKLASPNPRTYIGSGKVAEIKSAIHGLGVETVIFDDELSAGQLRNLEKAFGGDVRVCDRTALILDIFNQRAATHEAALQFEALPPTWEQMFKSSNETEFLFIY